MRDVAPAGAVGNALAAARKASAANRQRASSCFTGAVATGRSGIAGTVPADAGTHHGEV
jgi:hypothetical protein